MDQSIYISKINKIFHDLYKSYEDKNDLKFYSSEISNLIKDFNRRIKLSKNLIIDEKLSVLITYADNITAGKNKKKLKIFKSFYARFLRNYFNTIHFLPFYPSSSDSGFSVKDHYEVDGKLGNWEDIKDLSKYNSIMADIVINHSSSRGIWFKNFLLNKSPGNDYFFTIDKKFNSKNVVRPREHKLLKKIKIRNKTTYLWRTFSPDQIDLNFKNPKVLIRFIKIMFFLINRGVNIFRLDAIAYLWKESGTKCINHSNTHKIIKLLRIICSNLKQKKILITETNLPEKQNLSYFGKNDQANWIYNFSLPPLIIKSLLFENGSELTKWSKKFPCLKKGTSYLNFLASHDGVGMRPVEGLLTKSSLNKLFSRLKKNGGEFSYRKINGSKKQVYEANITLFNAFKASDFDENGNYSLERYLAAHSIILSFEGVPAFYFNSLFGTSNDISKFIITDNKRDLNRYKWNNERLIKNLKINNSKQSVFYNEMTNLIKIRRKQKAFHPNAQRKNLNFGSKFYALERISLDKSQKILAITNLTSKTQVLKINSKYLKSKNLLGQKFKITFDKELVFNPFQTFWLSIN